PPVRCADQAGPQPVLGSVYGLGVAGSAPGDEPPGRTGAERQRAQDVPEHAVLGGQDEALPGPVTQVEDGGDDEELEVPGHLGRLGDDAAARRARAVAVHRRWVPELRAVLAPGHQPALRVRGPAAARRLVTGWPMAS